MFFRRLANFCALLAGALTVASCSNASTSPAPSIPAARSLRPFELSGRNPDLQTPALLTINSSTGVLESWPILPKGGRDAEPVSQPLAGGSALAANGTTVVIANQRPPSLILYDVVSKTKTVLPDPYGTPVDTAVDKNGNVYLLNFNGTAGNVTTYAKGSHQPQKFGCRYFGNESSIAVDNEGDVFVNGYGREGYPGVVEIPNGRGGLEPQNCTRLPLRAEPGYTAGLAVDPKTDALIVLDDPDFCAGGIEGRMTIYPKPYQRSNATVRDLGANCAGGIRLDATSSTVFVGDADVSGSYAFILQRSYPDGKPMGAYYGGNSSGFTTIPNTLPN